MRMIYLAGFDVFRPEALAYGDRLKQLCLAHGVEGLYPLDNQAPRDLHGHDLACWIYQANTALIRRADAVMANLNPFRGAEPDSGTAFEVGYAVALGKPVWAYTAQDGDLVSQVGAAWRDDPPRRVDAAGYTVEDFGLSLNLMLACSATVVPGDAADCLGRMVQAART